MIEAIYKDPDIYLNFQEALKHAKIDTLHSATPVSNRNENKKIVVAISEILLPSDDNDIASLQQFIKTLKLKIQISRSKYSHKLVLPPLKNGRYIFNYISKPSEKESVIYTNGVNVFHISVFFSRIQFDKKKEYGILTGTYDCRPKCGIGYVIVVRKGKTGWEIYKVYDTWVS